VRCALCARPRDASACGALVHFGAVVRENGNRLARSPREGTASARRGSLSFRTSAAPTVIPSERSPYCHSERAQPLLSFRASAASRGIGLYHARQPSSRRRVQIPRLRAARSARNDNTLSERSPDVIPSERSPVSFRASAAPMSFRASAASRGIPQLARNAGVPTYFRLMRTFHSSGPSASYAQSKLSGRSARN